MTVEADLIDAMSSNGEYCSPIFHVLDIIANHSDKLLKTVKNLKHVVSESNNVDDIVSPTTNDEVDLCWCSV